MNKFKFNKKTDSLFKAILAIETISEAENFFRDLCTTEEIRAMSERWEIVQMLKKNIPYRQIAQELKTSTTTVARVALWLNNGAGGYRLILNRLNKTHHHNPSSIGKDL